MRVPLVALQQHCAPGYHAVARPNAAAERNTVTLLPGDGNRNLPELSFCSLHKDAVVSLGLQDSPARHHRQALHAATLPICANISGRSRPLGLPSSARTLMVRVWGSSKSSMRVTRAEKVSPGNAGNVITTLFPTRTNRISASGTSATTQTLLRSAMVMIGALVSLRNSPATTAMSITFPLTVAGTMIC